MNLFCSRFKSERALLYWQDPFNLGEQLNHRERPDAWRGEGGRRESRAHSRADTETQTHTLRVSDVSARSLVYFL